MLQVNRSHLNIPVALGKDPQLPSEPRGHRPHRGLLHLSWDPSSSLAESTLLHLCLNPVSALLPSAC